MGGASRILMLLSTPFPVRCPRPSSAAALRLARRSGASLSAGQHQHHHFPHSTPHMHLKSSIRSQLHTQSAQREPYGDPQLNGSAPVSAGFDSPGLRWPEWTRLVENLTAGGYPARRSLAGVGAHDVDRDEDSFAVAEGVPEEFARAAEVCLEFARDRPDALRLLTKKNIEVIVDNGSPALFKNGASSERRMRLFLKEDERNVLESEKAQTVDVMRYVLSYAYDSLSISKGAHNKDAEPVETSVRSLLTEFVNMSGAVHRPTFAESTLRQPPVSYEQFSRPSGQNIEMKRGDWICPKCSFMNFARNMRCLECEEARPRRQLSVGEWECPQCDFLNYGRNPSCLRCDCKCPAEIPTSSPYNKSSNLDQILSGSTTSKSDIEQRLAANDEKAERWFSKVSQLGDKGDISSAIADEDFPEIMPLRKGVNRFVVSTRKTPLQRRLANSQTGVPSRAGSERPSESAISKSLDRILGRTSSSSAEEAGAGATSRSISSDYKQNIAKGDPGYVPFVPLPPDMFSKPQNSNNEVQQDDPGSMEANAPRDPLTSKSTDPLESKNNSESSDSSERWSRKVAESDDVTDLASAIPDEDFPEIMPIRKGENRFVVSKKKDRSLTSPQYKRRLAMEQANKSDFVPFVPFPPGYFAKKDKQPEAAPAPGNAAGSESSVPPENVQAVQPENKTYSQSYNTQSPPENRIYSESYSTAPQPASKTCSQNYNTAQQPERRTYNQSYNAPSQPENRIYSENYNTAPRHESKTYGQNYNTAPQSERRTYNQSYNTPSQPGRTYGEHYSAPSQYESRSYNQSHNAPAQFGSSSNNTSNNAPSQPESGRYSPSYNTPVQPESGRYGHSYYTTLQPENRTYNQSLPENNLNESSAQTSNASSNSGISQMGSASDRSTLGSTQEAEKSQSTGQNWNKVFSGKSLEGSAVTEPDPLDMSEEAKAARWFRRAAQIKNISELSEIPDEDFPEIMPMRKGVNRFVVSKRKTPLERRLTSPQYRRNLPIVSSEPEKDAS